MPLCSQAKDGLSDLLQENVQKETINFFIYIFIERFMICIFFWEYDSTKLKKTWQCGPSGNVTDFSGVSSPFWILECIQSGTL